MIFDRAKAAVGQSRWHRRVVKSADLVGLLMVVMPILLGAYLTTEAPVLELAMYGLCGLVALPFVGPFISSTARNSANLLLLLLFGALTVSTVIVLVSGGSPNAWLALKGLVATVAWASVYVVAYSAVRTQEGVLRLVKWIFAVGVLITLTVYASRLFYVGEVIIDREGAIRAFGPLGDQVGFVVVLPALISLVSGRFLLFGVHLGALFLTSTRGAIACLALGVVVYFMLILSGSVSSARRRLASAAAAVLIAVVIWVTPISAVLMGRLSSPTFRLQAIELGVEIVRQNPLVGVGFNGFDRSRPAVAEDWLTPAITANGLSRASNQYVQTATDGGLPALLLLLLFSAIVIRNALSVMRAHGSTAELFGCQLWLISMLIGNQTSLWLLSSTASGFFIFAVAGVTARSRDILLQDRAQAGPKRKGLPSLYGPASSTSP